MKKVQKGIIIASMALPALLNAQGFQVNLQGQKQQAMGGTGTALVQDAATVFFNPGGVAFLKENSVSLGTTATIANAEYLDAASSTISRTKSPVSWPFTGYAVFGKDSSKLKFGLGIYTPFGSTVKWEDGWTGHAVLTKLKLESIFIQPTVSYKLNDKLGIGAGFVYGIGIVELQQDVPLQDQSGKYGNATLKGNANGFGFNAGIYYKPLKKLSIGLTYRSQVNMKISKGTATFNVPSSVASNFPSGPFTSSLPLPQVLTLGFAYDVSQKLTLALDVNYVGWSAYKDLAFDYKQNTAQLADTKLARDYKNTFAFRLGGQYKITDKFHVRAGLSYLITPIKDGYVTPEVPDATRLNYTVGLGYRISNRFTIDASYTFENLKRTDTNLENNMSGTYQTYISAPGLSLTYKF